MVITIKLLPQRCFAKGNISKKSQLCGISLILVPWSLMRFTVATLV